MKTTASQKVRIGIFTIIGILILVFGIYLVGKKKNMFGDTFHVYGTFNNVAGLQEGNNIRFAGIKIGTVEEISIISDSTIRVDMVLQSKIKPFLKTTSFASIGSDGLMGDKLVTITAGDPTTVLLKDGGKIKTINPENFDKSIAKISKVAENAEIISAQLAAITIQVRDGKGSMGRLLYNDDLARSLEGAVGNANNITASLADITGNIKSGKGSLGRLLYNDTLARSLEGTAANAKITMATIQDAAYGFSENMKALQGNFLLRGYFKKKEKEKQKKLTEMNASDSTEVEIDEDDLKEIEEAAEKAHQAILERKKSAMVKPKE